MNNSLLISVIFIFLFYNSYAQTNYNWPCLPFDQQHYINGTFCENRPNTDRTIDIHHFHDGVDIDLDAGNNVYSVINGSVSSLTRGGINAYIRVGRYAYVHVEPSPLIEVGSLVTAYSTVIGLTNSYNHIHFKDGYAGSEINALRSDGGLAPFSDNYIPNVDNINFYINGTTTSFAGNRLSGLVEIVAKARDRTDSGPIGDNNGIYKIGYQIYDSTGTIALTDSILNFEFDVIPNQSYVTNVFFKGSDLSNYYYTVTNRITIDGYWDTRAFSPGKYQVRVFTEDTRFNTNERWTTVEIVPQDIYPPANPEMYTLTGGLDKSWMLTWAPNDSADLSKYELFFSFDGNKWGNQPSIDEQIGIADTAYVYQNFANDETVYFRLRLADDAAVPNFSDFSDAYGVRLAATGPDLLIVDAFDRTDGYWSDLNHQFSVLYGQSLTDLSLAFDCCSDDAIIINYCEINNYSAVIYYAGDEGGQQGALSPEEQVKLIAYIESGGKLILSGSEIATDLNTGSDADRLFLAEYLRATHISDSAATLELVGAAETVLAGFSATIDPPGDGPLQPDVIGSVNSEPILYYADSTVAAVYYSAAFSNFGKPAGVVYLGFPLELISDQGKRTELIRRLLELLGITSDLANPYMVKVPQLHRLYDNYPNPFNPGTEIRFSLPWPEKILVEIFDISGRKINTVVDKNLNAGEHRFTWDGRDDNGRPVSSGVYFYRLRTPSYRQVKKMTLIR